MSSFSRKWLYLLGCVSALSVIAGCWIPQKPIVILTTTSPNNTYLVTLKGGKAGSPHNRVWANVFKNGQPLLSDIWLHSEGDTFGPFQAAYPDFRWVNDNVLEFYQRQSFGRGADSVQVENKTTKPINYLHLESINKFLIFDLQPGSSMSFEVPAPRLDSQWIAAEGIMSDGDKIRFTSRSFDRRSSQHVHCAYKVMITDAELIIEGEGPIGR